MKFWDREREAKWLKRYLRTEPNAILFVYGPKSSGKSTLLQRVVEELPKGEFKYYWYDLRERVISGYESVLKLFFKEKGWLKRVLERVPSLMRIPLGVFEVELSDMDKIFRGELDAFEEMKLILERDSREEGVTPVIVFDELQKLKEVYLNSPNNQRPLINELFNFFVRLTKVLHLSHVIVMTSDTFFIERIYGDSALKHTSR
ncbi:MAG: AAA family ATPase, partial [Synergistetes bacterium]|nr:AAA family ATPase [Synergistota bacterium]